MARRTSLAVILSAGGAALDLEAMAAVPLGRVVRIQMARGDRAACVAATVEHDCPHAELASAFRTWAGGRGWSVTIAPLPGRE